MGLKSKILVLLMVFFAGFATAIYYLAPSSQNADNQSAGKSFTYSSERSDEFAKNFNAKMHEYMKDAKVAAEKASTYIKAKLDEKS